jgi:hypothetical protein
VPRSVRFSEHRSLVVQPSAQLDFTENRA